MENTVKERLKYFLRIKGITYEDFGKAIGVATAYVSNIRKGIQPDKIAKIQESYPDLNIEWLLTGKGEMLNSSVKQVATGDNNTQVAGNSNNVNSGTTIEMAINEITEMRKLIQEQVHINQDQFNKFIAIIDRLTAKINP